MRSWQKLFDKRCVANSWPYTGLKRRRKNFTRCHACRSGLAERRSLAASAAVINLPGVVQKQHIPLRCRRPDCPEFGVFLWHNYSVRKGNICFTVTFCACSASRLLPPLASAQLGFGSFISDLRGSMLRSAVKRTCSCPRQLPTSSYSCRQGLICQGWFTWKLLTQLPQHGWLLEANRRNTGAARCERGLCAKSIGRRSLTWYALRCGHAGPEREKNAGQFASLCCIHLLSGAASVRPTRRRLVPAMAESFRRCRCYNTTCWKLGIFFSWLGKLQLGL